MKTNIDKQIEKKVIEIESKWEDTEYIFRPQIVLMVSNFLSGVFFLWNMIGIDGVIFYPWGLLLLFNILSGLIAIYFSKQKRYYIKQ